jgi:hypothetical protein
MKLIESTLIVIITAPPVLDETGMAAVNSYYIFVEVVLWYLYILLDEYWTCFEPRSVRKAFQMNFFSLTLFNDIANS